MPKSDPSLLLKEDLRSIRRVKTYTFLKKGVKLTRLSSCAWSQKKRRDLIRDEKGCIVVDKREDCNWTVASINNAIRTCRETLMTSEDDGLKAEDKS